jgi:SAM-dependent methyltransferase
MIETALTSPDRAKIFTEIFSGQGWGRNESASGSGSSLDATEKLRKALPELLENLGVKSILDIPCGDFHWMRLVPLEALDYGIHYIGADIVPELITQNTEKYGNPDREFRVLDVVSDQLPQADLIICRDCLVHLSPEHAFDALENMCSSGAKYLLTTTFPLHHNIRIKTGEWYAINLCAEPFPLPQPLLILNEGCDEPMFCDKSVGLWRIE